MKADVGVGDIVLTRSEGIFGKLIRLGSWLMGDYAPVNHVIIGHHYDSSGRFWGIEGRPGGVGWVHLTDKILTAKSTVTNAHVEKTESQRYLVAVAAESLLSVGYDWEMIAAHTALAAKLWGFWGLWPVIDLFIDDEGKEQEAVPSHVVCSSFADWAYEQVGLDSPTPNEAVSWVWTKPSDWYHFIVKG